MRFEVSVLRVITSALVQNVHEKASNKKRVGGSVLTKTLRMLSDLASRTGVEPVSPTVKEKQSTAIQ
jgi:hypothetical protein